MLNQHIAELLLGDALQNHCTYKMPRGSGGGCGHQILEPGVLLHGLHGLQGLPGLSMLAADFQVSGQAAGQGSDIGKAM